VADTTPRKDLSFRFAGLPPAIKLSIWLGSIVVLAAAIQSIAWGVGAHFHILHASGGGRGVLLAIALCTLLAIMAVDGRPAAEYGIVAHAGWRRHLFGGVLVGLLIHTGYWMLLAVGGIASVQARGLSGSLCLKATLLAFSAMPVSMVQQIIFSGYLLGILRDRYSRVVAVVVPAILFAVLRRIDNPSLLLNPDSRPELLGMFLLGVLLGSVRLQTGSIFRSAGLLAGLIFVRRWLRVTPLLAVGPSGHWGRWMAFDQDPLQSPAVWLMLAGAIAWVAYRLYRDGEPRAVLQPAADFKRVFPFSNSNMLTPLDVWLGRLADARFQVDFAYVPRLAAILVLSTINTLLTAVERILTPILVWDHQPASPVIIVGVHRSGTTHLHNLLALDPQFTTPRAYQVLNPAGFLLYSWLVAPLLAAFLPWRRPMDGVRFHAFAPQEDEFALAGMCGNSPHWGMTFPRRWAAYDRSIFPADWSRRERRVWQRCLRLFLAKLTYW
jgi:membrane protease YdiL (CAAX protease family)